MKLKALLTCITLCLAALTYAQDDFQGQATYMSKTTVDMDNFGGGQLSPERKKAIMDRMKSMLEKTYILTFNKTESTYKEDEKLEAPGSGGGRFRGMMSSFTAGPQYKNIKEGKLIQDQDFFGKQFLIKDELEKLEWKMTGETKQIGKYTVMKATAMKKVDEFDWTNFRGRGRRGNEDEKKKEEETKKERSVDAFGKTKDKNNDVKDVVIAETKDDESNNPITDIEVPKEVEVVAWYTMQIPINNGPGEFWGLPGLILEVSSGKTTLLCSKIVMNPTEKGDIKMPVKGKEVTKKEYNTIVKNKTEEMRETFRGRGGRGGRGR
ncbi:GLPGLI family protein [Lacinutrix sp.]|uniref:GLPGLI family protein n=1 Tax=Lacinutrix sp. TaxID=1937692 RepID=UPI0025BB6D4F|nr:GLPGLI family protein [Lacinutrix sp.]